jgi:hypothetical protein
VTRPILIATAILALSALLWQLSPLAVIVPAIVCGGVYVAICAIGAALDYQDERRSARAVTVPYELVDAAVVDDPDAGGGQ